MDFRLFFFQSSFASAAGVDPLLRAGVRLRPPLPRSGDAMMGTAATAPKLCSTLMLGSGSVYNNVNFYVIFISDSSLFIVLFVFFRQEKPRKREGGDVYTAGQKDEIRETEGASVTTYVRKGRAAEDVRVKRHPLLC